MKRVWFLGLLVVSFLLTDDVAAVEPCEIQVIDAETNWPVPLVELRTNHNVRFVSDNAGRIAFDLPELMGVPTWFTIEGHGYGVPKDGFGYRGVRLVPEPGEKRTVKVHRELPAKRLGRITGAGLFAESQKLGLEPNWTEQKILGCDSVQNAVHDGKLFWAWGDTILPGYPLGRFHMIGATTALQPLPKFEPPIRLRFDYVTDATDTPRNIAEMPGSGPTWLWGFVSLPDQNGRHRLVAAYEKIRPPLTAYEKGLCVWNEDSKRFEKLKTIWTKSEDSPDSPTLPTGHPVFWTDENGQRWVLFGDPFPSLRCPATFEAWTDSKTWQTLTPQSDVPARHGSHSVKPHRGAIAWSEYRQKWVTVFTQYGGKKSFLGEIWYAEADAPTGPWGDAIQVVTHHNYTFYNPQLHAGMTADASPILLFEATYTKEFSKTSSPTPRHNYNQILYRLDLDELDATAE
ncbi:hypothetical protein [Thalassoroseus pseudoceratinae]|uniref:hypothetical protein n=1 Tax=Thalassoroseus pseudoceratinae TaxID=2713176 RepID=UPI0019806206|nr:hypothetical protein [Thalassoroseus pseudoceratinae]